MGVVLANQMVRSKWGGLPAIFEHKLWQLLLLSYGTSAEHDHPMPRAKVGGDLQRIMSMSANAWPLKRLT